MAAPHGIAQTTTTWQATASANWGTAGNWSSGLPGPGVIAAFSTAGATQFATNNDIAALIVDGLRLTNQAPRAFTVGGNAFTIGTAAGFDMSAAAQNLTIDTGVTVGVTQPWNVAVS